MLVWQMSARKQKIQSNNKGWEAKRRRLREAKEQMNHLRQETTEGWQLWLAALRVPLKQKNCSACKGFFTATVTQSAAVNKVNEQIIVTVSTMWNTIRVTHQKRLGKRGSEQVPSSGGSFTEAEEFPLMKKQRQLLSSVTDQNIKWIYNMMLLEIYQSSSTILLKWDEYSMSDKSVIMIIMTLLPIIFFCLYSCGAVVPAAIGQHRERIPRLQQGGGFYLWFYLTVWTFSSLTRSKEQRQPTLLSCIQQELWYLWTNSAHMKRGRTKHNALHVQLTSSNIRIGSHVSHI